MSESLPPPSGKPKRPLRPLHGIPDPAPNGRTGLLVSGLFHLLVFIALLLPPLVAHQLTLADEAGAGGPGPAGGGGGGSGGTGGTPATNPERIRFVQVAPVASTPVPPPVLQPTPAPVPPPPPEPEPEAAQPQAEVSPQPAASPTLPAPGTGGGSGNDGSGGNGPGSGGGIGSGVGTGRGGGTGPGTGGGGGRIFPPQVINLSLLPLPVPERVKPYKLEAFFEVDERGNARLLAFNPTRDSGYNRKVREMLGELRFRPATLQDGTPVRDTAKVTMEAR